MPAIPQNTPVYLGGAWERCVEERRIAYEEAEFTDVRVVPELTVYEEEQEEFERLMAIRNQQKLESLLTRLRR